MVEIIYASAEDSRNAGIAYHLIPRPVWDSYRDSSEYEPEAYQQDGFIHLTLGLDPLLAVANMFYTADPREFAVLELQLDRITAPVKYEDPDQIYPHIYGLLNTSAVTGELTVERDAIGNFVSIGRD